MLQKIDIVNDAYSQGRISGLTASPTPEEIELALNRLESMMREFASRNIDVNYNFEEQSDPSSYTNADPEAFTMMSSNLAVRLCPDFGKEPNRSLVSIASSSLSTISSVSARKFLNEVPYPRRQPRGSGNTLRYSPWQRYYRNPVIAPSESRTNNVVLGEINDYSESFASYLSDGEDISGFTIIADVDLTISNASNTVTNVNYRVTVADALTSTSTGFQSVTIEITTTDGRRISRQINFNIEV